MQFLVFIYLALLVLLPDGALANPNPTGDGKVDMDDVAQFLCEIAAVLYTKIGVSVASIAVILMGIACTMGKLPWTLLLSMALTLLIFFQAPNLVGIITQDDANEVMNCVDASIISNNSDLGGGSPAPTEGP